MFFVFLGVFCLVCFVLSVPVQVIAWKDSSPKWPIMCRDSSGTLNSTHSLLLNRPRSTQNLLLHKCDYWSKFLCKSDSYNNQVSTTATWHISNAHHLTVVDDWVQSCWHTCSTGSMHKADFLHLSISLEVPHTCRISHALAWTRHRLNQNPLPEQVEKVSVQNTTHMFHRSNSSINTMSVKIPVEKNILEHRIKFHITVIFPDEPGLAAFRKVCRVHLSGRNFLQTSWQHPKSLPQTSPLPTLRLTLNKIAFHKHISKLRRRHLPYEITQANASRQTGRYSSNLPLRDERLSWSRWLGTNWASLPVSRVTHPRSNHIQSIHLSISTFPSISITTNETLISVGATIRSIAVAEK